MLQVVTMPLCQYFYHAVGAAFITKFKKSMLVFAAICAFHNRMGWLYRLKHLFYSFHKWEKGRAPKWWPPPPYSWTRCKSLLQSWERSRAREKSHPRSSTWETCYLSFGWEGGRRKKFVCHQLNGSAVHSPDNLAFQQPFQLAPVR